MHPLADVDAHAVINRYDRGMARDELQEDNAKAVQVAHLTDVITAKVPAQLVDAGVLNYDKVTTLQVILKTSGYIGEEMDDVHDVLRI